MTNKQEITTLSRIMRRNNYSIDISNGGTISIRKNDIDWRYLSLSLIIPFLLGFYGLIGLLYAPSFSDLFFVLIALYISILTVRKVTKKYRSELLLEETTIVVRDKKQNRVIKKESIRLFESPKKSGEIVLWAKGEKTSILLIQFLSFADRYRQDDIEKVIHFLSNRYLSSIN